LEERIDELEDIFKVGLNGHVPLSEIGNHDFIHWSEVGFCLHNRLCHLLIYENPGSSVWEHINQYNLYWEHFTREFLDMYRTFQNQQIKRLRISWELHGFDTWFEGRVLVEKSSGLVDD
jgi:hypothetical protein